MGDKTLDSSLQCLDSVTPRIPEMGQITAEEPPHSTVTRALRAMPSSQGCVMCLDPRTSTVRFPDGPTKAAASSPHIT